jgi:hypothetical protein
MVYATDTTDLCGFSKSCHLGVTLKPENCVVEDDYLNVDAVPDDTFQLGPAMGKAAVSYDCNDGI